MRPEISVVIPVRNGIKHAGELFSSLDNQTLEDGQFEVVIVDDGSTDSTAEACNEWVAARPTQRRLVRVDAGGPARARNRGWRATRGDWIAFTDFDTLPLPTWLESALEVVGRTGGPILEGSVEAWPPEAVGPGTHQIVNSSGGLYMTANMIYGRQVLERLGGFDERFRRPFLEDSDLAFRALDLDLPIIFAPEVCVRHRVIPRGRFDRVKHASDVQWIPLLAKKHPRRYREQLRPIVRPLSPVDLQILSGLVAAAAAIGPRRLTRPALIALALFGLRHAGAAPRSSVGGPGERSMTVLTSMGVPAIKAAWWMAGCARYRTFVW